MTRLDVVVPMSPGTRFLGGTIEQLGSGEPGRLAVTVLDERGHELAATERGTPGDWRLLLADAPRRPLTVVLTRDGRRVDSEQVELGAAPELGVPTLQLP